MGLISGLMGLSSDADATAIEADLAPILLPGEGVELAFQIVRDLLVFTDLRLIMVDKQGMTGRKRHIQSVPYRSITMFAIETAACRYRRHPAGAGAGRAGAPIAAPSIRPSSKNRGIATRNVPARTPGRLQSPRIAGRCRRTETDRSMWVMVKLP